MHVPLQRLLAVTLTRHWQNIDKIHSTPLLKYVDIESCVEVMDHILSHYSHYHIQSTILLNFHEVQGVLHIARCIIHLWNVYAKFRDAQCVVDCTIMMKICYLGLSRLSIINKVCTILITATIYTTSEPHLPEMLSRHILTCACSPLLGYRWEWQLPMVMWPWRCGGCIQQWHLDDRYSRKDPSCCSWYEEHSSLWPGWGTWEFKLCLSYRS